MYPCPSCPLLLQGDSGRGAGYSHPSMVASKRVIFPGSAAPCRPASVAVRGHRSSPRSIYGVPHLNLHGLCLAALRKVVLDILHFAKKYERFLKFYYHLWQELNL